MKKIYSLALTALVLLGAAGCTKEYYTVVQGTEMEWADYDVAANQWAVNQEDGYFMVELDAPLITREIVNEGDIRVSIKTVTDTGITWQPLPLTRAEGWYETDDGHLVYYSTIIDYEWSLGKVFIYWTATDFVTEEAPPARTFRVTTFKR